MALANDLRKSIVNYSIKVQLTISLIPSQGYVRGYEGLAPRILELDTRRKCRYGRMVSSGLLRRVALVRTDVSEESGASFIRVSP
jgi:hypothetical protein